MKIPEALNTIKESTKEEEIMTAKEENTLKEYTTGDLQRFINQKSQEETQKEVTVKDETPETSVTPVSEDNIKSETMEQSKEVETSSDEEIVTQPDIYDSDISKDCPAPKSDEELEDDTPETPVETLEQSKEDEKAGLDTSNIQMSTHDKSQAMNGQNEELPYGERRENFIKKLKENGIDTTTFEKGYIDIVKAIDSDKYLRLKAIKSRKNQMNYKLIEMLEDGTSDELENNKTILNPSDVEKGTSKVDKILMGMQGYYGDVQQNIKIDMSKIAKYRLLKPVVADSDVLNGEQIVTELKSWFKLYISDSRVASFIMDDFYHVALVKRGEKTPYKIFQEVMQEIAPANKTSAIKDWLYENNMLVHDSNSACRDTQKTLSVPITEQIDSKGDKCISFNFEEEYRKKYYEEYVKKQEDPKLNNKNNTEKKEVE